MYRSEDPLSRAASGLAAIAMTAITFAAFVVVPVRLETPTASVAAQVYVFRQPFRAAATGAPTEEKPCTRPTKEAAFAAQSSSS
jgi:hypothetical protein